MPEILQFGPFLIRMDWLVLALSSAFGYIAMKWWARRSAYGEQPILDLLLNGLLLVFIVWKLSPIVFTPSILWKYPAGLLAMKGSASGIWFGVIAALIYLDMQFRRKRVSRLFFADLISIGIVMTVLVYSLLRWQYGTATSLPWGISLQDPAFNYHPINVYLIMISMPMLIWMWRRRSLQPSEGRLMTDTLIYYSMALMAVSLFKPKNVMLLGLSGEQLLYLFFILCGLVTSGYLSRCKQQEKV